MNTTANIDMGDYSTPFAFGPKRKQFLDIIKRDGKKILSQNCFMNLDPRWKDILHRKIIGSIFDVKIDGGRPIVGHPIKLIIHDILKLLDQQEGITKSEAVVRVLNDIFSQPGKQRIWNDVD